MALLFRPVSPGLRGGLRRWLLLGAMALAAGQASAYSSVQLTVGGVSYTVAFTTQKTYNDCATAITGSPWWGDMVLAQQLAAGLGGALGAPTAGTYGPLFGFQTYGVGPDGVDNAAWNRPGDQVFTSNGNGWPVGTLGVYAVDPSVVDTVGNCTAAALATAAPFLQSVTPAVGPVAGGTAITIAGNNFTGATAVTIGGASATSITVVNDTTITAVTPAGTLGTASVLVTTSGGGDNAANTLFSYQTAQAALTATATPTTITTGATATLATTGGSGGGTVAYAVTAGAGFCAVSGNSLTGAAPGTCTVTATKAADAGYASATATVDVTVLAPAVNAACGTVAAASLQPSGALCAAGTLNLAGVVRSASGWTWGCDGANGGTSTAPNACTANFGPTGNNSGTASAEMVGAGGWVFAPGGSAANQTSGFIPFTGHPKSPPNLPPGYSFPHALFDFVLTGGTGAATVTLHYPSDIPANAVYWKYGPSPAGYDCSGAACASAHWYRMPSGQVQISGSSITLTIVDGGVGDDDLLANGVIVDQGGPGVPLPASAGDVNAIPTLSQWAMLLTGALLALLGMGQIRRRSRA